MSERTIIMVRDASGEKSGDACCMEPLWHLDDMGEYFLVGADLPYVSKEDLEVSCWQRTLEIKAAGRCASHGRAWSFRVVVALPSDIVADGVSAHFANQILEVRIPKDIKEKKHIKIE